VTPIEASREAAIDVYSAAMVPGAREWLESGDERHLPRVWRERLNLATEKIARRMAACLASRPSHRVLELPA
jgi:hypothetical protein